MTEQLTHKGGNRDFNAPAYRVDIALKILSRNTRPIR
jgi:hypothetical protein